MMRGHPQKIWLYPGTNFIGSNPVLKVMNWLLGQIDKDALDDAAVKNGTEWL